MCVRINSLVESSSINHQPPHTHETGIFLTNLLRNYFGLEVEDVSTVTVARWFISSIIRIGI